MTKKIKIIDLLNKIANGEEVPNKIKFEHKIYKISSTFKNYYDDVNGDLLSIISGIELNDKAEILDKEDGFEDINDEFKSGDTVDVVFQLLDKIKPLIRNQKKIIEVLREKGDIR
jgi:hypothetical protein